MEGSFLRWMIEGVVVLREMRSVTWRRSKGVAPMRQRDNRCKPEADDVSNRRCTFSEQRLRSVDRSSCGSSRSYLPVALAAFYRNEMFF